MPDYGFVPLKTSKQRGAVNDLLASGAVQQVLPNVGLEPVPLSILFVPARARIARVRLVIEATPHFCARCRAFMTSRETAWVWRSAKRGFPRQAGRIGGIAARNGA